MPQLLIVFRVVAAIRGLVNQTRQDLARWRGRPAPSRRRGGGRLANWWRRHATAGNAGYWGHQAAHGFPTARGGLHDGWTRGREAHHRARRAIARNQAEHAEGRVETEPELAGYRRRRDEALAEIARQREIDHARAEAELEDRWREDHPEPSAAATPEPADSLVMCPLHDEPLPCWMCDWAERLPDRIQERAQLADDEPGEDVPLSDLPDGGPRGWPAEIDPDAPWWGPATEENQQDPPQPEPEEGSQYAQEAEAIRDGFEYEDCAVCGRGLEEHDIVPDPLGHAGVNCKTWPEEQDPPQPEEAPASQGNQGEETMTETTYAGVKARMAKAVTEAEQRRDEAEQSQGLTEEHLEQARQAKNWASATADEMQALGVDAFTLGAMADHLSALDETEKAAQELHEIMGQVTKAWAKVEESAQSVTDALESSGHGQLAEAHANAAAGGAEKPFYGEG